MRILITGATGFIGRALVAEARRRDHAVVALSRDPERAKDALRGARVLGWDPMSGPLPPGVTEGIDAVIHLAGENVGAGRWTRKRMAAIRASRVAGTANVVESVARSRPRVFVCASATGWYGHRGDEVLTEESPAGHDFLAGVCRAWEAEAEKAVAHGVRCVRVRTGVVLGKGGGALDKMLTPFRMNVGGRLGSGKQWMSWIHLDDIVGLFLHAAETPSIAGPMLGVSPLPVTNREFTRTLGRTLGKWTFLPMPGFMLRVVVGKMAEVLLGSQRCDPTVAKRTGYAFRYPTLEGALRQIFA